MRNLFSIAAIAILVSASPAAAEPRTIDSLQKFVTKDRFPGCTFASTWDDDYKFVEVTKVTCDSKASFDRAFLIDKTKVMPDKDCESSNSPYKCTLRRSA